MSPAARHCGAFAEVMKQAAEYRQHAAECRRLALTARAEPERKQLLEMAAAWERMAVERERRIAAETQEPTDSETPN